MGGHGQCTCDGSWSHKYLSLSAGMTDIRFNVCLDMCVCVCLYYYLYISYIVKRFSVSHVQAGTLDFLYSSFSKIMYTMFNLTSIMFVIY